MSTDLISLSYGTNSTSLSSLTSGSTSSSTTASSTMAAALNTQSTDATDVSKGAQTMQKLSDLASSDPEKFKKVSQEISDKLTEAAKNSTDSNASKMLTEMAGKFSSAATSGTMDSLTPPEPPTGASGAQGQAAMKYTQNSGSNPMSQMDSIISDALSGTGSTSA